MHFSFKSLLNLHHSKSDKQPNHKLPSSAGSHPKAEISDTPRDHKEQATSNSQTLDQQVPGTTQQHTDAKHQQHHTAKASRFEVLKDGRHIHHLAGPLQAGRVASSLNDLVDLLQRDSSKIFRRWGVGNDDAASLQQERTAIDATLHRNPSDASVSEKWGKCQHVIGKGAFGTIRVAHSSGVVPGERLYAVKELRRRHSETVEKYIKRVTSEFCISSTLKHTNVVQTFDLLPLNETSRVFCQVMEYCDGGDLFTLIAETTRGLEPAECNCFFKQLMHGVAFLHRMGVVHRDLKPENLLLTADGCLKISDFGSAEGHAIDQEQQIDEDAAFYSSGLVGSEPYIAPEEFIQDAYDAKKADVWSCAVIYMVMKTGRNMWQIAREGVDDDYDRFIKFRRLLEEERQKVQMARAKSAAEGDAGNSRQQQQDIERARETIKRRAKEAKCLALEGLEYGAKRLIYRMLDPDPARRISTYQVLKNEWLLQVYTCHTPVVSSTPPTTEPSSSST